MTWTRILCQTCSKSPFHGFTHLIFLHISSLNHGGLPFLSAVWRQRNQWARPLWVGIQSLAMDLEMGESVSTSEAQLLDWYFCYFSLILSGYSMKCISLKLKDEIWATCRKLWITLWNETKSFEILYKGRMNFRSEYIGQYYSYIQRPALSQSIDMQRLIRKWSLGFGKSTKASFYKERNLIY